MPAGSRSNVGRAVASAAALLALLAGLAQPAAAGGSAVASGTATVSSATWGATLTTSATGTPAPGTVSFDFSRTVVLTTPPQYLYSANTGSRALARTSYRVDGIGGALLGNPVITLTACVGGTWNTSTGACTGTGAVATTIGTFTAAAPGPVDSPVAATSPGGRLHLQASVSNFGILGSFTAVFGASVTSSSPRQPSGPLTTNG